jgi:hypothetical protein
MGSYGKSSKLFKKTANEYVSNLVQSFLGISFNVTSHHKCSRYQNIYLFTNVPNCKQASQYHKKSIKPKCDTTKINLNK